MQCYCKLSKQCSQIPFAKSLISSILKLVFRFSGKEISSLQVVCLQILQ